MSVRLDQSDWALRRRTRHFNDTRWKERATFGTASVACETSLQPSSCPVKGPRGRRLRVDLARDCDCSPAFVCLYIRTRLGFGFFAARAPTRFWPRHTGVRNYIEQYFLG